MPDRLRSVRVVAVQFLVVVVLFAAVGAAAGWLWFHLWDAPTGRVVDKVWYADETGLRAQFAGTGLFVVIAAPVGFVTGALLSWRLDRSELATLGAVVVGSVLAGFVMMEVGTHLSAPDPDVLAATAANGTELAGRLELSRPTPYLAFPLGALLGLCLAYFTTSRRAPKQAALEEIHG